MKKLEDTLEWFKRDIIEIFGNELVSLVLYGSAATQDYVPKRSNINFLVVLTEEGMTDVWKAHHSLGRWRKRRIALPFFMTASYIGSSCDSFPIEFLNMRLAYHVLFGENPLKDIKIRNQDMRLQCEHELKSKLLWLRQGVVVAGGRAFDLKRLVSESLVSIAAIFRALLFLKNRDVPKKRAEVFATACDLFDLDAGLFKKLQALREGKIKLNRKKMIPVMKQYIAEIYKLSNIIDQMNVKN
jgi:predicted nucleotidyltransferase